MIRKILKINICMIALLCVFCSSLTAFAVDSDLDFDFNIQPEIPTTQEETVPVETEKETEKETVRETEKQTEKETTEKASQRPTKKPTSLQTTRQENREPDNAWGGNDNANVQVNSPTTQKETTTEDVPEYTEPTIEVSEETEPLDMF